MPEPKVNPDPKARSVGPRILIADPDQRTLINLRDQLKTQGYEIKVARDGAKALESAITEPPDLIILETNLPFITAQKLTDIIRSNPRTDKTPIIFIGDKEHAPEEFKNIKDIFLPKPLNLNEITNEIDQILRRLRQAEEVSGEKEITGTMAQIPLVDLLQVLTLNRREGKVMVNKSEKETCNIFVREGVIINAVQNEIEGEKALFRALTWKEGKFEFIPLQIQGPAKIVVPTGKLLLEGMRQADELERFARYFPNPEATISLKADSEALPPGLRPIIQEVLLLAEFYNRVQDIVDHCSFPDYEVYRALHSLIRKGIITETKEKRIVPKEGSILINHEAQKLREIGGERIRILFFAHSVEGAKVLIQALAALPEFRLQEGTTFDFKLGTPSLGQVGKLRLGEGFNVEITALPLETEFRPLWHILSRDTIGALIFLSPESEQHLQDLLSAQQFLSRLRFGPQAEEIRILGVTEDRKRPDPPSIPKGIANALAQLKFDRLFLLSPRNPAATREVLRQLLNPNHK